MNDETTPNMQEAAVTESVYTIEDYLRGLVRTNVTDAALLSICKRMKIAPGSDYDLLSEREIDLSSAWLYVWVSGSPSISQKVSDEDGDWSHSEGGESMSKDVLKGYLRLANELFSKWGEPLVGSERWGMVCGGFRNIRDYGGRRGNRLSRGFGG